MRLAKAKLQKAPMRCACFIGLLAVVAAHAAGVDTAAFEALRLRIKSHGGEYNVVIEERGGIRGVYADRDYAVGETLLMIPVNATIDLGVSSASSAWTHAPKLVSIIVHYLITI